MTRMLNATFNYHNGTDWDEMLFKTVADQVFETNSDKLFSSNSEKEKWNNKADRNHTHKDYLVSNGYINHLLYDGKVKPIAHRGLSGHAPENTSLSFVLAGVNNFWGTEADVCETADGHYVLMHDDTIDRMTNGSGRVIDLTLEEIKSYNIDSGTLIQYYPENMKVPTLEEYLHICKIYNMIPIMELKSVTVENLNNFVRLLEYHSVLNSCMVISFNKEYLQGVRRINNTIPMSFLTGSIDDSIIEYCKENNFHISSDKAAITPEIVKKIHKNGLLVNAWTINGYPNARDYIAKGVDFITTDDYIEGKEYELHKPYVIAGNLKEGRTIYAANTPYEKSFRGDNSSKNRVYGDHLNTLIGWETRVCVHSTQGYKVTVCFYDKNKMGIVDLGWLTEGQIIDIPEGSVYYNIYIGKDTEIQKEEWKTLRQIRVLVL